MSKKKIWYRDRINDPDTILFTPDILLYDFDIAVGDTVIIEKVNWWDPAELTMIVSNEGVDTFGNQLRRRIEFEDNVDIWVEGIGSYNGLFRRGFFDDGIDISWINCFTQDDEILIGTCTSVIWDSIESCNLIVDTFSPKDFTERKFKIFPNPARNYFHIEGLEQINHNLLINIHDISGKEVFSNTIITDNQIKIDTNRFPNGIYFLKIYNPENNKFVGVKKIIVHH